MAPSTFVIKQKEALLTSPPRGDLVRRSVILFHKMGDARMVRSCIFSHNTDSLFDWEDSNTLVLSAARPAQSGQLHKPIDRRKLRVLQESFANLLLTASKSQLDLLLVSDVEGQKKLLLHVFPLSLRGNKYEVNQGSFLKGWESYGV